MAYADELSRELTFVVSRRRETENGREFDETKMAAKCFDKSLRSFRRLWRISLFLMLIIVEIRLKSIVGMEIDCLIFGWNRF